MIPARPSKDEIFNAAVELDDATERQAYLSEQCAGDLQLRQEIESLLALDQQAGSFLESPPADLVQTVQHGISERPGTQIGPYKLLQQIGEGGMGVVYMAEQIEPIERRVALKIIKPGMDTRQVIARFEAERQALAMMDHPNIAKVLDAGVTETGRPYFVMELVKGTPLTQYCDERKLPPRKRLELFIPVCQAIQHAHHKGIIHRDIKPSNVIVAHYDDRPVPKVIDFGVAKAIDHRLTEKTMFTEFGQVLGTFEYMSPEQARLNQWDVDTRTDVYSLGVLLYELLSGETPFDRQRLRSSAFDELLRIIREEDPPRPSTRASTSQALPTIADNRKTEPGKLGAVIRGELDWIAMKALEKDRTRRYETANSLAADLERYLNDEPVVAGPPLARYRLAKFVKRNKLQVIAAAAVAAALIVALVGTTLGMVWALRERSRADAESHRASAAAAEEAKARQRAQENEQTAVEQKEIAERELARATEIKKLVGQMLGSVDPAIAQGADATLLKAILDNASQRLTAGEVNDEQVAAELHDLLSRVYMSLGLWEDAEKHCSVAYKFANRDLGPESQVTLNLMHNLAMLRQDEGRIDEAKSLYEKALEIKTRVLGAEHLDTLKTKINLGTVVLSQGDYKEAEQIYEGLVETTSHVFGPEDDLTLTAMSNLANTYFRQERYQEAETLCLKTLEIRERLLGTKHPSTIEALGVLSSIYHGQGRHKEANQIAQRLVDLETEVLGASHPRTLSGTTWLLYQLLAQARRSAEASDWDQSANDWVNLLERSDDTRIWNSPRKDACRELAGWPEVFARVAKLRPEETTLWIGRGQYHALRSQWAHAVQDYEKGFDSRSVSDETTFEYAGLRLLHHDQQDYQRLCNQLAANVAETQDSNTAFIAARTCGIGAANQLQPEQFLEWAAMRLQVSQQPWDLHVRGLAHYRAKEYQDAIHNLELSNSKDWGGERGAEESLNWIVMAMCHHQLGHAEEARECFDKANRLIATAIPKPGEAASLPVPDWIEWHVLLIEATELLGIDDADSAQAKPPDSS